MARPANQRPEHGTCSSFFITERKPRCERPAGARSVPRMIKNGPLVASLGILTFALAGPAACASDDESSETSKDGSDSGVSDASNTSNSDAGAKDAEAPTTFTVGGTVTGLQGDGLVLENDGEVLAIPKASGTFTFPKKLTKGASFNVTAKSQPTGPSQTCVVTGGSGTVSANVTDVKVTCTTKDYPVTVNIAGLAGTGLVLTNNDGDDLAVSAGATTATFSKNVQSGKPFTVAVKTQPSGPLQSCTVSGGTGTVVAGAVTTVTVNCTMAYTVGGTVSGLAGTGLVLQNNAGDDITVNADSFSFPTPVSTGTNYAVTVKNNPQTPWQTCVVNEGTGQVAATNVSSVTVTCTTDKHIIRGTVSGLTGTGATLQLTGGGTQTRALAPGATSFAFDAIDSGTGYTVSLVNQPTTPPQTCSVTADATGVVKGADITSVKVECATNKYRTRVKVTGLSGTGLVLQNNGGDDLVVNASGTHDFDTRVTSGHPYAVTLKTLPTPSGERCDITSTASGIVVDEDVDVSVTCDRRNWVFVTSARYSGNLGGLAGADAKCQERAAAAGLSGTFKAWLSDTTGSPSTRFVASNDPYVLVDGTVIADNYTELTSGTLKHAINKTETGGAAPVEPIAGRPVVWTGTNEAGRLQWWEHTCTNWTSSDNDHHDHTNSAILGNTTFTTSHWTFSTGGAPCDHENALYCFEQ
jgi:Protein of unknown function (DUF1554)